MKSKKQLLKHADIPPNKSLFDLFEEQERIEGRRWSVMVQDPQKVIDRNVIGLESLFSVTVGKTPLINGHCKIVETKSDDDGLITYTFAGFEPLKAKPKQKKGEKK